MPTDAPFDPCRQWLGIDAVHAGNARLMLGVSPQEADPLVVLRAAEARLNLLRAISPGPFEMARAGLIKRVEEAREKLLAEIAARPQRPRPDSAVPFAMPAPPSQRAAAGPPISAAPPAAIPPMPPAMPPVVPAAVPAVPGGDFRGDGVGGETIAIRPTVYRKKTPVAGIATALLALSAVAGWLVYYAYYVKPNAKNSGERQSAHAEVEAPPVSPKPSQDRRPKVGKRSADPTSDDAVSTSKPPSARNERRRPARPEPKPEPEPEPQLEPEPKPEVSTRPRETARPAPAPPPKAMAGGMTEDMAEDTAQLDATLAEALEALQRQEYDTVTTLLTAASKKIGDRESGSAARQRLESWQQLAVYSKGFMDYRQQALAAVRAGDEYDVKNQKVGVVEVDADTFKYRSAGGNKTVPRDKIPAGIVLAIVMQWFDENPANDLYLGAYHLSKPEPDLPRAREHWEKAQAGGADASGLMPLLDDPVFAKSE
jgi:outer membrane biosynthesis protein TonB